jgi:transcriptional regulator with XRE-family HTH domain
VSTNHETAPTRRQSALVRVTGPLRPRRNIAVALKQLREDSGKLLNEVARDLMISTSKLSRLENAQGRPLQRDIRDLIHYYGIEGTQQAEQLWRWVDDAQRLGWWMDYDEKVVGGLDEHLAYEADAKVERAYTLPFLPALLHTEDYARAHIQNIEPSSADYAGARFEDTERDSAGEVEELVKLRMERQKALTHREGPEPLKLVAVTHESALLQAVGSPKVLRDQLDALIERSKAPNVSLHVLPFSASPVFTMTCMYAYFEYRGDNDLELDVVHVETHAGFLSVEDPVRVADYRKWHDALVEASLTEDESRNLIRSVRDDTPGER